MFLTFSCGISYERDLQHSAIAAVLTDL